MKYKVVNVSTVNEGKAQAGIKAMFGDAEFTILAPSECKEFKEMQLAQTFTRADEIAKIKKEKEAALKRQPVDIEELKRIAGLQREISKEESILSAPTLIKDWNINEKAGEFSASLVSRFAVIKPDAVIGEVGSRTVKFSREAAEALCADEEIRVNVAVEDEESGIGQFRFYEWISLSAGDEEMKSIYDKISVEKVFVPLELK